MVFVIGVGETKDARDIFKKSNDIAGLRDGCGKDEARELLRLICKAALDRGENWRYKWRGYKFNNSFLPLQLKKN